MTTDYNPSGIEVEEFINAAVTAIGWTTYVLTEDGGDLLEDGEPIEFADMSDQWDVLSTVVETANREELEAFITEHYNELLKLSPDMGQHGYDYVVTAGGHGAGFWDRGYPREIEAPITEACRAGTGEHMIWADNTGTLHYEQG